MKTQMKKIFFLLLLCGICVTAFASEPVLAKNKATQSVKMPADVKPDYCLYIGQSFQLSDLPEEDLTVSDDKVLSVSKEGLVKALHAGIVSITYEKKSGKESTIETFCTIEVKANELLENLSFSDTSFPAKIAGSGSFTLDIKAFEDAKCVWTSGNTAIATVDEKGNITPLSAGTVEMKVTVTDSYGGVYEFSIPIRVLNPHFSMESGNLAKGCLMQLDIADTTGAVPGISLSDSSVVSLTATTAQNISIRANKVGTCTITANVDGVNFTSVITVTDPAVKTAYGFYQKKKSLQVYLKGTNNASKMVWQSSNTSVATVSLTGKVKTLKYGSAVISCLVDGRTVNYYLAVSTKTAVKAMKYGYSRLGKAKYSQARRMNRKFFDCSSFVYRSYRAAGKYLVRKTSWAPVAADIAHYYVRKKKYVKASGTYNLNKLRPGDLVCFGGNKAKRNGRYKRIYHIAMYIGNGKTMESSSAYNNVVIRDRGSFKKSGVPVIARP